MKPKLEGSITVEAVFVVPIVMLVIFSLCYEGFYLYDKVELQSILNEAVQKEERMLRQISDFETEDIKYKKIKERAIFYCLQDFEAKEQALIRYIKGQCKERLYFLKLNEIESKISHEAVQVWVKGSIAIGGGQWGHYLKRDFLIVREEAKAQIYKPSEFVRCYQVMPDSCLNKQAKKQLKQRFIELKTSLEHIWMKK